jgi:hypothetical protein
VTLARRSPLDFRPRAMRFRSIPVTNQYVIDSIAVGLAITPKAVGRR